MEIIVFYLKILGSLNSKILNLAIENFWINAVSKIEDKNHIAIIVKIRVSNGSILSLGSLIKLNLTNDDKKALFTYITEVLKYKEGGYDDIIINEIIFSYGIIEGRANINLNNLINNKKVVHLNYSHYKLPIVNPFDDMSKYGNIFSIADNSKDNNIYKVYSIQADNGNIFIIISEGDSKKLINKISIVKKGLTILTFEDTAIAGEDTFIRNIGSRKYLFSNNGDQLLLTQDKKIHKYIKSKRSDSELDNNFITADIETYFKKGSGSFDSTLVPYLFSFYDGITQSKKSFFLTDYLNIDQMIFSFINQLVELSILRKEIENNNDKDKDKDKDNDKKKKNKKLN